MLITPDRIFVLSFSGISGEFGPAMVFLRDGVEPKY